MKICAAFILATIAVSVLARRRYTDLNKIPHDKLLPLHQAPECYQSCFQSPNHGLTGYINTVNQRAFCEDEGTHFDWWFESWMMGCAVQQCPKEDHDKIRRWFNSICRI